MINFVFGLVAGIVISVTTPKVYEYAKFYVAKAKEFLAKFKSPEV